MAQDGSLTKEFPKMSAKERSRIATKEAEEAAADKAYQERMTEAEKAFQDKRYEDALAAYGKARELRPYNVYPKVKIEDLKALLRREGRPDTTSVAEPAPSPVPSEPKVTVVKEEAPAENVPGPLPSVAGTIDRTGPTPKGTVTASPPVKPTSPVKAPAPKPVMERPAPVKPKGTAAVKSPAPGKEASPLVLGERTYKEGNAVVFERTVEDDGQPVVYKRVSHPWGQTFYFKDGLSVGERVWKERFSER